MMKLRNPTQDKGLTRDAGPKTTHSVVCSRRRTRATARPRAGSAS